MGASQRIPLSVLARNPHKGIAREIFHESGRGRGKEGPRDSVSWREQKGPGQSREGGSREKWAEQTSRENRAVDRSQEKLTVEKGGC